MPPKKKDGRQTKGKREEEETKAEAPKEEEMNSDKEANVKNDEMEKKDDAEDKKDDAKADDGSDKKDDEEEDKGKTDEKKAKKRGRSDKPAEDDKGDESAAPSSGREKRARKSASNYKPEDFHQVDHSVTIVDGKGTPLGDLEETRKSIESYKDNSEELATAYRFLFPARGKVSPKQIKQNILKFKGYLPVPESGATKEAIEKSELAIEKKYSLRAYKLNLAQIKKLCDVFAVDRTKITTKDNLVDILLDFLGEPSEEHLKGSGKKEKESSKSAKKGSKKDKKEKAATTDEESSAEEEDEEEIEEGKMPTDKQLRQWVRAYVKCFNTSKATLKTAMTIAEEKFGVSLQDKKNQLKKLLTEEV